MSKTQLIKVTVPDEGWAAPAVLVQKALERLLYVEDRWREVTVEVVDLDMQEEFQALVKLVDENSEHPLRLIVEYASRIWHQAKDEGRREAYADVADYINEVR